MKAVLTCCPIVTGSTSLLRHEEILWVIKIGVLAILDVVDDTWLEVDQQSAGYVMLVICLVEEDVLPVFALSGKGFQNSIWRNSML